MSDKIREQIKKLQNGNDVRGSAIATETEPQTFTADLAAVIAKAFAGFLSEKAGKEIKELRVGIGHDSRVTADEIAHAAAKGLGEAGVYDCGLITTPAMFQSVLLEDSDFDGSIMLTASHLPFNRNGMKFFTKDGALSHKELDDILEKAMVIARECCTLSEDGKVKADKILQGGQGNEPIAFDMVGLYCKHMKDLIKKSVNSPNYDQPLDGLHIVVDAGNGAAGFFATDILEALGADIEGSQFLDPDGYFPNHVPNPENKVAMQSISEAVVKAGADLGVIFDCDGDRGAVVFSDGTPVNRNTLIALLSAIVAEYSPGSYVVTDSITSDALADFLTGTLGLKHLRFKRGYKNVIDKSVELNASGIVSELAIETSGHGAFKENHFSDDGAYIAVKIICKMAQLKAKGERIESLIADLKQPAEQKEIRYAIEVPEYRAYGTDVLEKLVAFGENEPDITFPEENFEGVRLNFDNDEVKGWMLLRLSLHDPQMAMNLEADRAGGCDIILKRIEGFLSQFEALR